ncbi:MAG: T9SS type A sorting domain-containing protein [Terriglobales bacterium]
MKTHGFLTVGLITIALFAGATLPAFAQQSVGSPEVFHDIYHDVSAPVSTYPDAAPAVSSKRIIRPLPHRQLPGSALAMGGDETQQTFSLPQVAAPTGKNFDGLSDASNGAVGAFVPSDDNIAVGTTQVVETINDAYRVYSKSTGASLLGPKQISSIFTGMTGLCGQGASSPNFTDPVVVYDKISARWVITVLALNSTFTTGNECIAVSSTSSATSTYHRYAYSFGTNLFNDYPKFGVWPNAYYASYNMFTPTSYAGAKACAYNRAAMLAGTPAIAVCFTKTLEFSFLPSDMDGAIPPTMGEPNFFIDLFSSTSLHLFKFHVDFVTTTKSTFTGPVTITVPAFTPACSSTNFTCIPQGGTTQKLDSLGDRLMFRLPYRNYGTHESLVITHSVKTGTAASALRWYEIRTPSSTPSVFQQGTFGAGSTSLWMGSIAMDKIGEMAMGFSKSSSTAHPAIGYTGRVLTDPLNTMEAAATIFTGAGSQMGSSGANRWGDYSSLVLDPVDDCTFWYVNQYIPANGVFNFHTRLASFKFPACT